MYSRQLKIRQIAILTTLSGAEFSNATGVLDTRLQFKEGYLALSIYAQAITYDPEVCLHMPEWLLLSTAIRSLDHAVESFCSFDSTPYHQSQFLHAMGFLTNLYWSSKRKPRIWSFVP